MYEVVEVVQVQGTSEEDFLLLMDSVDFLDEVDEEVEEDFLLDMVVVAEELAGMEELDQPG